MKLDDADLLRLLPEHISGDPQFAAASEALRPFLGKLARAIPNLLIYARLGNASPDNFLPPLRRLTEAGPGLDPLDLPALESLAWQFHVDFREVAETRSQLAGMVLNSIAWHRIKGTPAGIKAALSLFNFGGIHIDEHDPGMHWATWQLGFDEVASLEDLALILKICNEMQPARCRLWRVYTADYDYRPGVWSGPLPHNAWSVSWWGGYSGTYFPDLPGLDDRGLLISFALKRKYLCEGWAPEGAGAGIARSDLLSSACPFAACPVWSVSRWSDPVRMPGLPAVITQLIPLHGCEYLYRSTDWPAVPWRPNAWAISRYWDRPRPRFAIFTTGIPLAQGCWSEDVHKGQRPDTRLAAIYGSGPREFALSFAVPEGKATISPSVDRWTENRTQWASEVTRTFYTSENKTVAGQTINRYQSSGRARGAVLGTSTSSSTSSQTTTTQ